MRSIYNDGFDTMSREKQHAPAAYLRLQERAEAAEPISFGRRQGSSDGNSPREKGNRRRPTNAVRPAQVKRSTLIELDGEDCADRRRSTH
jgi:hypothetical protein